MSLLTQKNVRRILVARGDALGDLVLATVVIRPLRAMFPDAEIYFLARKEMIPLLEGIPEVAGVIENNLGYTWRWSELPAFFSLCREIRAISPDIFLGLWEKRRYAFLSFLARIPIRVGYAVSLLNRILYTDVVPVDFSFFFTHQAMYNLALLQPLGIKEKKEKCYQPELAIGCPEAWALSVAARYPRLKSTYVCVQVDGSAAQKTWLPETCVMVIRYLSEIYPHVVMLGRPDSERRELLATGLADLTNITDLTDQLSLPEVTAVLSRADLFVGLDSGFAHLASAFNVASVVYFLNRTQNALRWAPLGRRVYLVFSRHACPDRCVPSVCQKRTCREGLLFNDLCGSIDRARANRLPSPSVRLRQLTVAVISDDPEGLRAFFAERGVRVLVIHPDLGIRDMVMQLSSSNVMWILLDRVPYRFSYRIVRLFVANQVMWPALFLSVHAVSDVETFLERQGL